MTKAYPEVKLLYEHKSYYDFIVKMKNIFFKEPSFWLVVHRQLASTN